MSEIVLPPEGEIGKTDSANSSQSCEKVSSLRNSTLRVDRISMDANAKPRRSQKKRRLPLSQRATLTPEEFAAQFGKQKIWAYRQIYAGRIKGITGFGNLMIPRSEIDRILKSANAVT
jgi:hypothetical protein